MNATPLGAGTPSLAADANALGALRRQAGQNNPAAVKEAARQFESMFMRELIKSMREATMKSGMLDSAQENISRDLLDQQLAVQMSGRPGGLSELIERQLSQKLAPDMANATANTTANRPTRSSAASGSAAFNGRQSGFVQEHRAAAAKVEQSTGIPASYMLGQAGHETGWGKSQIRMSDGSPSFNLFGIKAGANWTGKVAEVTTTEYVNGQPQKVTAKFRAYDSYEASFRDYAQLIGQSPRYAQAKQSTHSAQAYASELQRAGYATDPQYADKLSRAINSALRLQRLQT